MILLSLDLGKRRVGVAISHGILAEGLLTLDFDEKKKEEFFSRLQKTINEQKVEKIIVGLPLGKDGNETEQTVWTSKIGKEIEARFMLPFEFVEESFSTVSARERTGKKKEKVDHIAAQTILEQYLNGKS